ncbi:MAG: 3-oxoacyl-ACP synthase [Elusimicrobia bacterium HGW-Elusimicrobia-1]|jgi:3-oxoacyl-[acyl-carrier-protein] synthase-3|nr:MAG: 3-oxoacyl-ACP synthase [Elusimicrobia bacterium HGW-Elusimicrobia-1]
MASNRVKIEAIEYYLPQKVVTNDDIKAENPSWNVKLLEERTGVRQRHISSDNETALDLALTACKQLFKSVPDAAARIDGLIFCTESEDYILPPNCCMLHKMLDLPENVFAFDYNLACSGFIYGLALARGLVISGQAKNILLINADTYSKYINKQDRATRILFGDGAAVTLITAAGENDESGILDIQCATSGKGYDKLIIPSGGNRMPKTPETSKPLTDKSGNTRTLENIYMDGMGILSFVNSRVPSQVSEVLNRNGLSADRIDMFIFHQASAMALDSLERIMGIPSQKSFRNIGEAGNTVGATIPICLKNALDANRIISGNTVVLSGFGVGLSWGTALVKI